MKKRLITGAIGSAALLLCIFVFPLWLVGAVLGALSVIAAWEILHCTFSASPIRVYVSTMVSAFLLPLIFSLGFEIRWSIWVIFLLFFVFSCELIFSYRKPERNTFEMVAISMLAGVVLPMMLGYLGRIGVDDGAVGRVRMMLPFVIAFTCDTGAYFSGRFFGKHKLAENVSPHKTVEGGIGGIICSLLCTALYGWILIVCGYTVDMLSLALFALLGSVISQLGDLTFSAIKRQYGIKDFGNILPGHGGVLDRFDSIYYLVPLTEFWMLIYPAIRL